MPNKSLKQMVPELLEYIQYRWENNIVYARESLDIYEGNVETYLEASIRKEITSPKAVTECLERITPINTLKQVTNKLSQSYTSNVIRKVDELDQEWLDYYTQQTCINSQMVLANKLVNLHAYCGAEPYLDGDKPALRILDASRYIAYSDDPVNPARATHAIKWITNIQKREQAVDSLGRKQASAEDVIREVKLYYIYDDTQMIKVDGDGVIHETITHNLGKLPIVHISMSPFVLIPQQDTSKRRITIQVSKALTDLFYGSLYQNHSRFYGVDVNMENMDSNPDSFMSFKSDLNDQGSNKSGTVGILQPKMNIPDGISLINQAISMHLASLGLAPGQAQQGANSTTSVASGVSKMIDEAGNEQVKQEQREVFKKIEENKIWPLMATLHNQWLSKNSVAFKKGVNADLDVVTSFEDKKPSESEKSVIERVKLQLEAGLTSKKRALIAVHPDLDDTAIDELMAEIEAENSINIAGLIPDANTDGDNTEDTGE